MLQTLYFRFYSVLLIICFAICCGQQEGNKLIDEMNAARVKAQSLVTQAEGKRAEAYKKFEDGERPEGEKLMDEAAKLYGSASEVLNECADKTEQAVRPNEPDWYKEYFSLYSKYIRNLARLAGGAQEELLVRKRGAPSEAQLNSWKENISKLNKENAELKKGFTKIEVEHGAELLKQD